MDRLFLTLDRKLELRNNLTIALLLFAFYPVNVFGKMQQTEKETAASNDPIELDIFVFDMVVSPDERYVVAWGNTPSRLKENANLIAPNVGYRDVRVVDLKERRIISRGTFPSSPISVTVEGKSIFVALSGLLNRYDLVNAKPAMTKPEIQEALKDLYVFDLETMEPQTKVRLPQVPLQLYHLPNERLGIQGRDEGQIGFSILDVQSTRPRLVENNFYNLHDACYAKRNATQIEYGGVVYDNEKNRVVSLSWEPPFEPIFETNGTTREAQGNLPQKRRGSYPFLNKDWQNPYRYGRQILSGHIYDSRRNSLFSIRPIDVGLRGEVVLEAISETTPVCYSAFLKRDLTSRREFCYLNTFRLLDGEQIGEPVLLFSQSTDKAKSPTRKVATATHGSTLVVASRSQIFDYRFPNPKLNRELKPMTLYWPNKPWILADQVERFTVPYDGGKGKVEFALKNAIAGVQIDKDSGEISVDAPQLWQRFVENSSKTDRPDIEIIRAIESDGAPRDLSNTNAPPSRIFKKLFGESYEFSKIPTYLKLEIVASDDFGQIAELVFYVTILGEFETLQAGRKNRVAVEKTIKKPAANVAKKPDPKLALERMKRMRRISFLETRLFSLEKKIGAISKKIEALPPPAN